MNAAVVHTAVHINDFADFAAPISIVRPTPLASNFKLVFGRGSLRFASILQRVAQNDRNAVKECIDKYGGLVWGMVRRFANDNDDQEQIRRDIFDEIWKRAGEFDPAQTDEVSFIATLACERLNKK